MKNKITFLAILVLFIQCNIFGQTANIQEGCVPLEVLFQAPAGATKYYWDFKDGVTSKDLANPKNVFLKAGIYDVAFHDTPEGPVKGTVRIKVYAAPKPKFSFNTGCAPFNVQFKNLTEIDPTIVVSNYVWLFGDQQKQEGQKDVSHLYEKAGKYSITLNIQTKLPSCTVNKLFEDTLLILTPPVATFTTTPSLVNSCNENLDVSFTNTSVNSNAVNYSWDLGNGKTSTDINPPAQKYSSATIDTAHKGLFNVIMKVSLKDNPSCSATVTKAITVGGPKPKVIKEDTVCINTFAVISTAKTAGTQSWIFQGPATKATSSKDTVHILYKTPGYHKITLKVNSPDGKCSGSTIDSIYVDEVTANISSDPNFSCNIPATIKYTGLSNQSDVTYKWFFANGPSQEGKNVSYVYNKKRDSLYTDDKQRIPIHLTVISNKSGCSGSEDTATFNKLPNAIIRINKSRGCIPLSVNFNNIGSNEDKITSWKWSFGDGTTLNSLDDKAVNHTYTKEGEYYARLIITTESGCFDTSYAVLIQAGTDLTSQIDFKADKNEVCPGEIVNFTSINNSPLIDAFHFSSEENHLFHCDNNKSASWSYNNVSGLQDVSLIVDYNGCLSTKTKPAFINVKGAIAKLNYLALCSDPMNYTFIDSSMNATNVVWDFGDKVNGTAKLEKHIYTNADNFLVTLTANNDEGCAPTTDQRIVKVRNLLSKITIDSALCIKQDYVFSSKNSKDVFANCHTGYTWQFPGFDRRPVTTDNNSTIFSFNKAGNYNVRLISMDENGCIDTAQARFKVYDIKMKAVVDDSLICTPANVKFTNLSISDTAQVRWYWNFGDSKDTIANNPIHTYTTPPKSSFYSPYLIAFDTIGCSDTIKFSIKYYTPASTISASKPNLCLGDTIKLSASDFIAGRSHLTYNWDFGNGIKSLNSNEKVFYDSAKSYSVKLKFTEISSNCSGTTSIPINVQDYPIPGFSTNVDSLPVLCAPQNVYFKDTSKSRFPLTYAWKFEESQTQTSPLKDPNYTYKKGDFNSTQTVSTSFGCARTIKRNFKVYRPEGNFTMSEDTICRGEEIMFQITDHTDVASYTWAFGDGYTITKDISDVSPVSHAYNFHPASGKTYARLVVKGAAGICPVENQKDVNIYRVIADFDRGINGDTSICMNDGAYPFYNKSLSNTSFNWSFGDGTNSNELNPVHTFPGAGSYQVMLTVANNLLKCKDTIIKSSIVYDNPVVLTKGDTVCQGKSLDLKVLNPGDFNKYTWSPETGLSNVNATSQTPKLDHTVDYIINVVDTNQCKGTANIAGVIIEEIGIKNFDTSIVVGDEIALPIFGPGVYNFRWSPASGLSCYDCNYPKLRPLEDVEYNLHVSDLLGCFENNYNFKIKIKSETFVKLPSAFTPADDEADTGPNNYYTVNGWGIKELLEYNIFNRWGQLLYSTTDLKKGWDGKFKGIVQNNDVYVYKVKVLTWKNEILNSEGYFNLIH